MRLLALLPLLIACSDNAMVDACPSPGDGPLEFSLLDQAELSPTYDTCVSPADFDGAVTAWYFGLASCPICQGHWGALNTLYDDIDQGTLDAPLRIMGINRRGAEASNPLITEGNDLPWLQDDAADDVFETWPPSVLRELKIVGVHGDLIEALDLNTIDPRSPEGLETVRRALLDAAGDAPSGGG